MSTACLETPPTHGYKAALIISRCYAWTRGRCQVGTFLILVKEFGPISGLQELTLTARTNPSSMVKTILGQNGHS